MAADSRQRKGVVRFSLGLLVGFGAAVVCLNPAAGAAQTVPDEVVARLSSAAAIQSATRTRLGVLGDAFACSDARFASFWRSDAEPQIVDQWYVASQLWADALFLHVAAADGDP